MLSLLMLYCRHLYVYGTANVRTCAAPFHCFDFSRFCFTLFIIYAFFEVFSFDVADYFDAAAAAIVFAFTLRLLPLR